jgi:hypothetical protein
VKTALLCLSTLCLTAPLGAEEIRVGVPLPELASDPADTVRPVSAQVGMIGGKVSVVLSVRATEDAPALLLEGPLFGWSGPSDPYPDRNFPELEFRVDGAPITPEDNFRAFVGKANVTNVLKTAAVDPWVITRTPPVISSLPANEHLLRGLKSFGAIETSGDTTLAKWTAQRIVRIPLKQASDERVEWDYRARPTGSRLTGDQVDTRSREKTYCISPTSLSRLRHSGSGKLLDVTEYSIATGIDGKPPGSVTFTMSPPAGDPSGYVFFCGPHGKSMAQKGSINGGPAEVDDAGILSVMTVAAR